MKNSDHNLIYYIYNIKYFKEDMGIKINQVSKKFDGDIIPSGIYININIMSYDVDNERLDVRISIYKNENDRSNNKRLIGSNIPGSFTFFDIPSILIVDNSIYGCAYINIKKRLELIFDPLNIEDLI